MLTAEYINDISTEITLQYERLQTSILLDIKRRYERLQAFTASSEWQVQKLRELGMLKTKTLSELIKISGKTQAELKKQFKKAGIETIKNDGKLAGVDLPIKLNEKQIRILTAGLKKLNSTIRNMTGITLNDTVGLFERITTDGYNMASSGAFTLEQASMEVGKTLAKSSVGSITYSKTGYRNSLEGAVERAIRTGVNQTMISLSITNAEAIGTNLVETSAHEGARPEHAIWQGKVFSINGGTAKYPNLAKATGYGTVTGLGGANCRHNFFPYVENVSDKAYSRSELKGLKDERVKYDNKEMSFYEATQIMRSYERKVRALKKYDLLTNSNSSLKIKEIAKEIKRLNEQTGAKIDRTRLIIY